MALKQDLASRLKALREQKGLTKYRLAKLCGISETYLYRLELGAIKNPRRDTLQALAKGLGISLAELIGETSPLDTWGLVELSLKAYIPVYAEVGGTMGPVDYVVCTRTEAPPVTVLAYRVSGLYLEPEIRPGDTIIVDTGAVPAGGELVVVVINGHPAVKRYGAGDSGESWVEDNEGRRGLEGVTVHGVVTDLHRKLR